MADSQSTTPAPPQELANALLGAILAHVRHVGGDDAVVRTLVEAGESRSAAEVEDPVGWSTYAQGLALFHAAAKVLDDPDVGRKAGAAVLHRYHGTETVTLLRSLGSPGELLKLYPAISAKQSTITRAEVLDVGDRHAVLQMTTIPPHTRDRLFCDYTRGAIAEFPVLFGMERAEVDEVECQARGDRRCLLRVTWDPTSSLGRALDEEVADLRAQVRALTARYEALEAVAAELAGARDVDVVLETVIQRAGMAVRAPRYLLAVRLPNDRDWRVHAVGFDPAEARRAAQDVLACASGHPHDPTSPSNDHTLVVDVASAHTTFGKLAAFSAPGLRFLPAERSLLAAYASHAAAALETAAALDEARERNETLSSLLALGTAVAEATTVREVARRIAESLPGIVASCEAHVLLFDPEESVLARVASARTDIAGHRPAGSRRLRDPRLATRLVLTPGPTLVRSTSDPVLRAIVDLCDLDAAVCTPIVSQGSLKGVLVVPGDRADDAAGRERLVGVASLAATALTSVELLDRARHQALHDPLTDLPNARLFEAHLDQAIAEAERSGNEVAVLFLDLDRFKAVNDTYGHHTGDDLLRAVATRLQGTICSHDTVARMGGDEFAIILRSAADLAAAEQIARAVVAAVHEPFALHDIVVKVDASVGVARTGPTPAGCASVVRRADAAMYAAKAAGRGCYRIDPASAAAAPTSRAGAAD
jgi:diguanylate cyclase (GGDEF)-like protein